jgi:outer membrane lipoprotein-sorting protein
MKQILFVLLWTLHVGVGVAGNGEEDKKTVIHNLKTSNERITSLQASMKQRKVSSFMDKEVVTKAQFYYQKPGQFALIPNSKEENRYIVNDKTIWIINDKTKTVTETNDGEMDFSQYFAGVGNSADQLEKWFEVTVDPRKALRQYGSFRMELVPLKSSKLYGKIDRIVLLLRDDLWLPYMAEFQESDGDVTVWEFSDFKLNKNIKESIFARDVPKGYAIKKLEKN